MAKTLEDWRKMEAEELRKRDINQRKALTVSDWRKEQARQERENLRLSKLHTKLTLGEDWRTNPKTIEKIKQWEQGTLSRQREERKLATEKAAEDMRSGKTSSLVGKQSEALKKVPTKQVFKAMILSDPTQNRVFDSKEDAEAYLKQTGQQGAVAGVRMSGTPEKIESSIAKYKEEAEYESKNKSELDKLYAKRKESAQERLERIAAGKVSPSEAGMESIAERIAEKEPERAAKFAEGYRSNVQRRMARADEIAEEGLRNIAEGKASGRDFFADVAAKREAGTAEQIHNSQLMDLRSAAQQARKAKDFSSASNFEQQIKMLDAGVPKEAGARRRYFERMNVENYKRMRGLAGAPVQSQANPF
jgi:hypothetical protein